MKIGDNVHYGGRVYVLRGMDPMSVPDREEWMLQYLARANRGPLSSDGLRELFEEILALTKREVERGE